MDGKEPILPFDATILLRSIKELIDGHKLRG